MIDPAGPVEPALEPDDRPVRAGWREISRPSRRKVIALLLAAGAMVVLLCFASGWFATTQPANDGGSDKLSETAEGTGTQPGPVQANHGKGDPARADRADPDTAKDGGVGAEDGGAEDGGAKDDRARADRAQAQAGEIAAGGAGTGKADAARAAADKARADKLAAAQAADARAEEERAAGDVERPIVMPELAGRRLNVAMDLATDAGLTAVTVCRTPDGDSPLWWSNWQVTAQDVPAGARIDSSQEVCLAAEKP